MSTSIATQMFDEAEEAFGVLSDIKDYAKINGLQQPTNLYEYLNYLDRLAVHVTQEVNSDPNSSADDLSYAQALRDLAFELQSMPIGS
jgi:hypothetical protein